MAKAGAVVVQFTVNANSYSAGVAKIKKLNQEVAESATKAGHATVSQMQASSAAIRELENPLGNNIRAIERLATTIPGVGAALQAAFPVVGAIALAAMIAKTTMEVAKLIKETEGMASAIQTGFTDLKDTGTAANDTLRITNDRLRDEIALLEHKPINGVALALDEARKNADELLASLKKDSKAIDDLIKANEVGFFGQLMGKGASSEIDANIRNFNNLIQTAARAKRDATQSGNAGGAASAQAQLDQYRANAQAFVKSQVAMRSGVADEQDDARKGVSYASAYGDQSRNIAALQGFGDVLSSQKDRQSLESDNADLTSKKTGMEATRKLQQEAAEAARRAQEAQLKGMNDFHEQFDAAKERSRQDEMDFWSVQLAEQKKGSLAYNEAFKNLTSERLALMRQTTEEVQKFNELSSNVTSPDSQDLSHDASSELTEKGRAVVDFLKGLNEGINLNREYANSLQDQALAEAVATGAMTARDAAIQKASIHYQQYLNLVQQMKNQGKSADDIQRAGQNYQIQANADQFEISNSSFSGQWKNTLNDMANQFKGFNGELISTFRQTVDSLNAEIVTLLSTRHTNGYETRQAFKQIGNTAFKGVASAGLKGAEGALLGGLGFGGGKLGTKTNPMYVKSADTIAGAAGGAGMQSVISRVTSGLGGLFSKILGLGGSAASGGTPGLDLPAYTPATVLPGFASGGPVSAGMMALVGERGPEVVRFGRSGTVIPNDKIGGDTHHHYNIDARGSTNPMETKRQIQMALAQAAPRFTQQAVRATREYDKRRPSSARA